MNQPQVYMCPPVQNPVPTSSHPIPLGCPRTSAMGALLHALHLHWSSVLHMVMYVHLSMVFSQIIPPSHRLVFPHCSLNAVLMCHHLSSSKNAKAGFILQDLGLASPSPYRFPCCSPYSSLPSLNCRYGFHWKLSVKDKR